MALTPKQEKFCLVYIETGNASEAYRQSYNIGKMKPESINRAAKQLLDNAKIATRLKELQAPAVEKAQITLESHLDELKELRDLAKADQKWASAIQAETNRGKAAGLYTEKIALNLQKGLKDYTNEELAAILAASSTGGAEKA